MDSQTEPKKKKGKKLKYKNTTDIPDKIVHQMLAKSATFWRRHLNVPFYKKHLSEVKIKNSTRASYHGYALWLYQSPGGMVYVQSINQYRRSWAQIVCHVGEFGEMEKRLRWLAHIVAHEVGHIAIHFAEDFHGRRKTRYHGKSGGGDEEFVDRMAGKFVHLIEEERQSEMPPCATIAQQ